MGFVGSSENTGSAKKKAKHGWFYNNVGGKASDLIGNAADDIKSDVTGLITGPVEGYRAIRSGRGGEAAQAIWDQMQHGAVGELAQGHFGKAGREAWKHPVNTLLDAAAVAEIAAAPFTGGASLALTAPTLGARGSRVLEAMAGLRKIDKATYDKLPDHLRTVKGGKGTYAKRTRDWHYDGRALDAGIAPELLPANMFDRMTKVARMAVREKIAPDSVARKITKAAERQSGLNQVKLANGLVSEYATALDALDPLHKGFIHVALSTAYKDPMDSFRAFRKHTEDQIAEHGETKSLLEMRELYKESNAPIFKQALYDDKFNEARAIARRMSNTGAAVHIADMRPDSPSMAATVGKFMSENKTHGDGSGDIADFGDKAIRSEVNVDGKFATQVDPTIRTRPGQEMRNRGKNREIGAGETDPLIYQHQMIKAIERNLQVPAAVKIASFATPVKASSLVGNKAMKQISDKHMAHIHDVRAGMLKMPPGIRETELGQSFIKMAEKLDNLPDGEVLALPAAALKTLNKHMASTAEMSKHLRRFDGATNAWRAMVLNLRPAWMVANVIGSAILLNIAHPVGGMKAAAQVRKVGRDGKVLPRLVPSAKGSIVPVQVSHSGHSSTQLVGLFGLKADGAANKILRSPLSVSEKMGKLNEMMESPWRSAAFVAEANKQARHAQANAKKLGTKLSHDEALAGVLSDPRTMDYMTAKTLEDMIDFGDLTEFERNTVRRILPFYSWMKGISKRALQIAVEHPAMAAGFGKLSQFGVEENGKAELAGTPSFMRGAINVGEGSDAAHRKIITTQAWNPLATVGDVAGMVSTAAGGKLRFGGDNVLSSTNPLVRAPIEALTNRNLFYGSPLHRDAADASPAGDLFHQMFSGLPQSAAWTKYQQQNQPGADQRMFKPSSKYIFANYMGLPVKDLNVPIAKQHAVEELSGPTQLQ